MHSRGTASEALNQGLNSAKNGNWTNATESFRRAISLEPGNVEACFRLGWALWQRAEGLKPNLADLAVGYGAQLLGVEPVARERARKFSTHRKMLRDSCHWLREAIARDPAHARAHFYLAQALKALGYHEDAEEIAKKAADLDPGNLRYATLAETIAGEAGHAPVTPASTQPTRMTWDDVVLNPRTKRELRQMQVMLEKPDLARELGVDLPTGILLKGPPGTGKTTIARVLADEAKCRFFSISAADINRMFVGESEKRVRALFEDARANAPSIIFIDEIDSLLPERQGGVAIHSDKVVTQFLQEMDGMTPNHRVFVVGASNRPDMLDHAVRRGGRLSREIEIPLPDCEARKHLLGLFLKNVRLSPDVDVERIGKDADGWSGADLRALVNEAGLQALIRVADSDDPDAEKQLTAADFATAVENLAETGNGL
jgi:transitional endoplasmic reticulum ATPase